VNDLNKKLKYGIVGLLLVIACILAYRIYADYCYTSGLKGNIITFTSPRDYNFDFGTIYNDEYTKADEPNANAFNITDNTLQWYVPSGSWGLQASFLNETFWKHYFISLTLDITFKDSHGETLSEFMLGYNQTYEYLNPSAMFVISGEAKGAIIVRIQGIVNSLLEAGQVNISCTAIVEWCPKES
jgi:hypothetical protein